MTFKHVKFGDSEMMRSFEKVAFEKGLAKPEVITKKASSIDLVATDDLMHNIVKLCSGLRQSGFNKYADELESNFLALKMSSSIYETSKETGEDLVDAAHPDGSHELEDIDGDSLIETIIDQQLADLEMAGRNPTGKMSNAQAINSVRVVLGQVGAVKPGTVEDAKLKSVKELFRKMTNGLINLLSKVLQRVGYSDSSFIYDYTDYIKQGIDVFTKDLQNIDSAFSTKNNATITLTRCLSWANRIVSNLDEPSLAGVKSSVQHGANFYANQLGTVNGILFEDSETLAKNVVKPKSDKPESSPEGTTEPSKGAGPFSSFPIATDLAWAKTVLFKEQRDLEANKESISKNSNTLAYVNNYINTFQALVNDLKILQGFNNPAYSPEEVMNRTRYFKGADSLEHYQMVMAPFKTMKQKYDAYWGG